MALNTDTSNRFREAFEKKCFKLMIGAYMASINEKVIQLDWEENDISSELNRHITKNQQRLKWKITSKVEDPLPNEAIPKIKGFANKLPIIDFKMATITSTQEYEYFFEAKNLKQNNIGLERRYIHTGIDSFVSEKYYNGSLVGYLLEGETNKAIERINRLLKKDRRSSETLCLASDIQSMQYNFIYQSNHTNIGILKHLIFDFANHLQTTIPNLQNKDNIPFAVS